MKTTELRAKLDTALDKTLDAIIANTLNPNATLTLTTALSTLLYSRQRVMHDEAQEPEGTVDIPEVKP